MRCRWAGRDFKGNDNNRDDLFAATPPLEANKTLISRAASQKGMPKHEWRKLSFIDIRKAHCHAPATRDIYVDLPDEFIDPGERGLVCGKFNYSLYGTRDAAKNWESHYASVLVGLCFKQG